MTYSLNIFERLKCFKGINTISFFHKQIFEKYILTILTPYTVEMQILKYKIKCF